MHIRTVKGILVVSTLIRVVQKGSFRNLLDSVKREAKLNDWLKVELFENLSLKSSPSHND